MNLKELSEKLGLSQTTVSRALNGYPEVSEGTRERVAKAAALYKYHPNSRAKGLALGRAFSIGHVIPLSSPYEVVNPIFADFLAGGGEIYSSHGYDQTLTVIQEGREEKTYRDIATKGSVDGIVLHGPRQNDPRIGLLQELGLPFIVHGRCSDMPTDYSWVDINNKSAFKRATEFLLDFGHERIALLNGDEAMQFASRRRHGFEEALDIRNIAPDSQIMFSGDMTEKYGYEFALDALTSQAPPTAFLASSVLLAIGVRRAVHEIGLQLGKDISLITHDDDLSYLPNSGEVPMFTATRSSVRKAGRRCAEMLLDVIEGKVTGVPHELWDAELLIGASTGPVKL